MMQGQKTHKNTAGVDCRWAIGLLLPEGLSFVTRVENYPSKCFYWESGKEAEYFGSRQIADDYAYGMMLNGHPAVVMEIPKCYMVRNSREKEDSHNETENGQN